MKLVNTYSSRNLTRRCLMYVDGNGYYTVQKRELDKDGFMLTVGTKLFRHVTSAKRAIDKWIACT